MDADGTFVAMNNVVSQSVPHLHTHVVPRRRKDGCAASSGPGPSTRPTPRPPRLRSGPQVCNLVSMQNATSKTIGWFAGRLPDEWFTGAPEVTYDRDEILVVGALAEPESAKAADDEARAAARRSRVEQFRDDTRHTRMRIADGAEERFGRKVAWGVDCGGERVVFTSLSVPVMTRLRMRERAVLDTLVDASVARSRSEALAWCVRLVAEHESDWIGQLRDALKHVEKVRADGASLDVRRSIPARSDRRRRLTPNR